MSAPVILLFTIFALVIALFAIFAVVTAESVILPVTTAPEVKVFEAITSSANPVGVFASKVIACTLHPSISRFS